MSALVEALRSEGIEDERVLAAFAGVDRGRFLRETEADFADEDCALSIGNGHMSPQPSLLARTLEIAAIAPGERILEIGAGSGYLTALCQALGAVVFAVELDPELAERARQDTSAAIRTGDGADGWAEHAPYALILATGGVRSLPEAWTAQLEPGGRIVAPVGSPYQRLERHDADGNVVRDLPVDFASLTRTR